MGKSRSAIAFAAVMLASGAGFAADTMNQMQAARSKMDQQMQAAMQSQGSMDERFARMMIPHHQGAVDMARLSLDDIKDSELRQMAEKTLRENEKGVQELQAWLKKHNK